MANYWNRLFYLCVLSHFSCVQFCDTLWTIACQAPLSIGFSRQEYCSGLSCRTTGDLPDPGIKRDSPASPALQADSLPLSHRGSPFYQSAYSNTASPTQTLLPLCIYPRIHRNRIRSSKVLSFPRGAATLVSVNKLDLESSAVV